MAKILGLDLGIKQRTSNKLEALFRYSFEIIPTVHLKLRTLL